MSLSLKLREWKYWHIDRKTRKFIPWVGRKLPKRVKYAAIIAVAVQVEPKEFPGSVTAEQMLKYLEQMREYQEQTLKYLEA